MSTEYFGTMEHQMEFHPGFLIIVAQVGIFLLHNLTAKPSSFPHPFLSFRDLAKISCKSSISLLSINKADKML